MLFKYQAQSGTGNIIEGEAEASDKFSLVAVMKKKNYTVILAKEIQTQKSHLRTFFEDSIGIVRLSEKIVFIKSFGAMLKAGLSVSRSLSVLERQTKNKTFRSIINALGRDIAKGSPLHKALGRFPKIFSSLTVAMVSAGEESGTLPESLAIIGEHLDKSYELQKKIRGALIYPAIILSTMIGIGILMLTYVVPILTSTFQELGVPLPLSTKVVIGVSSLLRDYTIFAVLFFVFIFLALLVSVRTVQGKKVLDFLFLKIPIIGALTREVNSARTARTMSSLLTAGVTIIEALNITKDVIQNSYYKEVLEKAKGTILRGTQLSFVFSRNEYLYPVLVAEMTAVGEETGKLPEMLLNLAIFYENEVTQKTKDISTIIEPVLMVIIGISVGFFAISMITPLYSVLGDI
ncbi:MAG: type II secretion system F family protein [bacterium]|nr:type II secretion system F family protein [bacterium]